MANEDDDVCHTCQQSWEWHQENNPVHPFNRGESGAKALLGAGRNRDPRSARNGAQRGSETPPTVVWPSDPVLRIALMNAGILTADNLRDAEQQLRAAMGDALKGGPGWSATGEESTGSSTGTGNPSTRP